MAQAISRCVKSLNIDMENIFQLNIKTLGFSIMLLDTILTMMLAQIDELLDAPNSARSFNLQIVYVLIICRV